MIGMGVVRQSRWATLLLLTAVLACSDTGPDAKEVPLESQTFAGSLGVDLASMTKLPSGVYIKDLQAGSGTAVVVPSSTILAFYTGWLANGAVFDTNVGGTVLTYPLANLIPGWQSGLLGLKVGGKRRLVIPSALAYGAGGSGPIPPFANLVFDVELTGIR
ncbi:MAG: FKBP-type peptidyl-prolyl cis-trans isomerase [Gemmatimonadaceae bacterium]